MHFYFMSSCPKNAFCEIEIISIEFMISNYKCYAVIRYSHSNRAIFCSTNKQKQIIEKKKNRSTFLLQQNI